MFENSLFLYSLSLYDVHHNVTKQQTPMLKASQTIYKENLMADENNKVPLPQRILDNPFLLLAAGLIVMFGFYTFWGLMEIMNLPKSTLP